MGHPQMMRDAVSDLKKQGYYRFVAIFTWTGEEDKVVLERFTPYIGHNFPPEMGIDSTTAQFYYLTGSRTELVIGYTNSAAGLERFCASIYYGTDIKIKVYHAVEGWESAEAVPKELIDPK